MSVPSRETFTKLALGERLKELRGDHTLRFIAAYVDLSVSYLSDLENGRTWPSLKTLIALADVYKTTVVGILAPVNLGEIARESVIPFDEIGNAK